MEKHKTPHYKLVEIASNLEKELLAKLSNSISISDLFEIKKVMRHASNKEKNNGVEKLELDTVFRKADFVETIEKCLVPYNGESSWNPKEPFQGMYVFSENGQPVYVGISRNVFSRIKQHFYGNTHFSASLAYFIEKKATNHSEDREKLIFFHRQEIMRENFRINIIPITCDYELYWMEVTLAGMLGTMHNEFRTH